MSIAHCRTYAMVHIPATIAFMAYSYRYFAPQIFQSTRRTLVICNCLAFIIFSLWPCMPPRLLPFEEFGYIDTLHTGKAASIWTTNKVRPSARVLHARTTLPVVRVEVCTPRCVQQSPDPQFQNQLAAFPSLHFGYSFVIGLSLFVYSPHRPIRMLALFYPLLILLVIMSTANHYLLDAVGGFFVTVLAHRFNRVLLNLRPIEEWGFWIARTEKPMDKAQFQTVTKDVGVSASHRDMSQRPLMSE